MTRMRWSGPVDCLVRRPCEDCNVVLLSPSIQKPQEDKALTAEQEFKPLNIAVLTLSDTRTAENDTSGDALVEMLTTAGHTLA